MDMVEALYLIATGPHYPGRLIQEKRRLSTETVPNRGLILGENGFREYFYACEKCYPAAHLRQIIDEPRVIAASVFRLG